MGPTRVPYDQDDDAYLVKYIATYNADGANRMGNALYKRLVENAEGKWPWAKRHSWQSWRERYKDNQYRFKAAIKKYQKKHGVIAGANAKSKKDELADRESSQEAESEAESVGTNGRPNGSGPAEQRSQTNRQYANGTGASGSSKNNEPASVHQNGSLQSQNRVARKTARKTVPASKRPSTNGDAANISDGTDSSHKGKRRADAAEVRDETKRRKLDDVLLDTPDDGDSAGPSRNDNITNGGTLRSVVLSPQKYGLQRSSAVGRCLGLLSVMGGLEKFLNDEKVQKSVVDALRLTEEEQEEVLEYARSQLQDIDSSVKHNYTTSNERLYPQITEDDIITASPPKNAVPGAWDDTTFLAAESPMNLEGESSQILPVSGPAHHEEVDKHVDEPTVPIQNESAPRRKVSKAILDDDYFQTPSPSPEKQRVDQPSSSKSLASTIRAEQSNRRNGVQTSPPLPKRDPPRFMSSSLTKSFVPTYGRTASQKRLPDLDSASDTEVITDDEEPPRNAKDLSTTEPWPPARKKKVVGDPPPSVPERSRVASVTQKISVTSSPVRLSNFSTKQTPKASSHQKKSTIAPSVEEVVATVKPIVSNERELSKDVLVTRRSQQVPASSAPEPGPSRLHVSAPRSTPNASPDKTKTIRDWRSETHWSESQVPTPSDSLTTVSDPFLTTEHARRLRKQENGKEKEMGQRHGKGKTKIADAKHDRRQTFAGFPTTQGPPEIDLRRKALRSSIAGNPVAVASRLSTPSSTTPVIEKDEREGTPNENRRSSITATVDLSRTILPQGLSISPADHIRLANVGLQVYIQAIAKNHGVPEEWVRNVYQEKGDLPTTDRTIAKMREAAIRAFEESRDNENEKRRDDEDNVVEERVKETSAHSSPERRETDLSALSASQSRSATQRRRSELFITPADEDPFLIKLRSQYAPPSASRAARYVRDRARRSSGMTGSPLNPNSDGLQRDEDDDSEKEEMEVDLAVSPSYAQIDSPSSSSSSEHAASGFPSHNAPIIGRKSEPWTAEEDEILDGEDEDAIQAIIKRRGRMAVKWHFAELSLNDNSMF